MPRAPFDIQVRTDTRRWKVPMRRFRRGTTAILRLLGFRSASLSILLLDDRKIRRLNRRYLGENRPTDVIAFEGTVGGRPGGRKRPGPFLGDLAISLETTSRQAADYENPFFYELMFYVCHGVLHLMGYRDKTRRGAREMDRIQTKILRAAGVSKS